MPKFKYEYHPSLKSLKMELEDEILEEMKGKELGLQPGLKVT